MHKKIKTIALQTFATVSFLTLANAALALEFQSIQDLAILYESQSNTSKKLYFLPDAMPVEVLVRLPKLTKVRDATGTMGWVENVHLSNIRTVQVISESANLYASPDANAPVVAEIGKDVGFYVIDDSTKPWIHVRHIDGAVGYLHISDIWGM